MTQTSSSLLRYLHGIVAAILCAVAPTHAQNDPFLDSFAPGREYFILRSGNARMIIESNTAGTQPGVTYLLFDADKPCQTLRKERAFNYEQGRNCTASALELILAETRFTAVPHMTRVRWAQANGIPTVEAQWWAGGIRVTESFLALADNGTFLRRIVLEGADLAGPDTVRVRLSLPASACIANGTMLAAITGTSALAIGLMPPAQGTVRAEEHAIVSAPIPVRPGGRATLTTCIVLRTPAPGLQPDPTCPDDTPIPATVLRPDKGDTAHLGLTAAYYNNLTPQGSPAFTRTDSTLSPYWGTGSPAPSVRPDSFSVRWTGTITPPRTGRYRFSLKADDGARLFIGGTLLVDRPTSTCNIRAFADIDLTGGTSYPIMLEYTDLTGYAGLRFRWSVPTAVPDAAARDAGISELFASMRSLDDTPEDPRMMMTFDAWKNGSTFTSRDTMLGRLYDNARFALPGMVGARGRMDAGIFEYGDQWVRDGSNVALGLIHAGQFEQARALISYILTDLVAAEGATMVAGAFDDPDREEFDQMGELMHVLKAWHDWTGDTSLIVPHRKKILTMIERPLRPSFRDSTGMVHNHREFWERTFDDAYELAYQTFMVQGLRDAADLAPLLGVTDGTAHRWRREADAFRQAMLHHPTRALVDGGRLIKRRNVDGTIADMIPGLHRSSGRDDPASTEAYHRLNPDASAAIPLFLRVVDPRSSIAKQTLDALEGIWNARWDIGGYERYHSSSQQDQPGPWCFATGFMARAQHEAGLVDRSYRSLAWLAGIQGGAAGAWFEEIPLNRTQIPTAGVVVWTSAEVTVFMVRHMLGVWFEGNDLVLRPHLFPADGDCRADLRFRAARIRLTISGSTAPAFATVNGIRISAREDGSIVIPERMLTGELTVTITPGGSR